GLSRGERDVALCIQITRLAQHDAVRRRIQYDRGWRYLARVFAVDQDAGAGRCTRYIQPAFNCSQPDVDRYPVSGTDLDDAHVRSVTRFADRKLVRRRLKGADGLRRPPLLSEAFNFDDGVRWDRRHKKFTFLRSGRHGGGHNARRSRRFAAFGGNWRG